MLIYLHISKTAGTTMLHYLERQCKTFHLKSWWVSDWVIPEDTECLFSHCPYGEPDKHHPGEHQYITFLRDPVDRVISRYYHILHEFSAALHSKYMSYSIEEIVKAKKFSLFENGMVRILSGRKDIGDLAPQSAVTRDDLERAKENISKFTAVGFVETFNPDLVRIAKIFGWTDLRYNWYRKGQHPPIKAFSADTIDAIKEQNKFDLELVEFVRTEIASKNSCLA